MNENQSSTRMSHSLAAAAALLEVSEKTLRRRIKAGEVEAEKVSIDGGGLAWRVYLEGNALDNVPEPHWTNALDVPEVVPEPQWTRFERESRVLDNAMDTQRPNVPEVSIARAGTVLDNAVDSVPEAPQAPSRDESTLELLALLRERLTAADERERQMSLQIEAANRQAAEATAALREYLKMQNKALPEATSHSDTSSTRNDGETSRENRVELAQMPQTGKQSQDGQKVVKREMRPLWKVILGIR